MHTYVPTGKIVHEEIAVIPQEQITDDVTTPSYWKSIVQFCLHRRELSWWKICMQLNLRVPFRLGKGTQTLPLCSSDLA